MVQSLISQLHELIKESSFEVCFIYESSEKSPDFSFTLKFLI